MSYCSHAHTRPPLEFFQVRLKRGAYYANFSSYPLLSMLSRDGLRLEHDVATHQDRTVIEDPLVGSAVADDAMWAMETSAGQPHPSSDHPCAGQDAPTCCQAPAPACADPR